MTAVALPDVPACTPVAAPTATPTGRKIRAFIADDQQLEREVMRRYLATEPDIELVGTAVNGVEAVDGIQRLNPDLVFLDVQMPEMDGFGVVAKLDPEHKPVVIFVTANEEFARQAFDVQALDYLIKPCRRERLHLALDRARKHLRSRREDQPRATAAARQADRVAVKSEGRILLLELREIEWLESSGEGVTLHCGNTEHATRESLASWEQRLPSERFLRISRSIVVNLDHVREFQPLLHGEYSVLLRSGTRLTLTRAHRSQLHRLGV